MSGIAPAFPIRDMNDHPGPIGVTMRDYFAAKAMQGLLANSGGPVQKNGMTGWNFTNCTPQNVAALAYEMADEMLKARIA